MDPQETDDGKEWVQKMHCKHGGDIYGSRILSDQCPVEKKAAFKPKGTELVSCISGYPEIRIQRAVT